MADDIMAKEGAPTLRIDTLSYHDKAELGGDDCIYFQKIEEKRGRMGVHIDASKWGTSPTSLECSEFEPLPGHVGSGRHLEAERAAVLREGGYRTVLSGIGGDEFTGGIPNPTSQLADLILQFKFITLVQQLTTWSLVKRRPWIQLLGQALMDLLPPSLGQHFAKDARVEAWIESAFAKRTKVAIRLLDVDEHFGLWLPSRRSYIGGVMLMASKLSKWKSPTLAPEEIRYPYLDQDLIRFILSIPAGQLLRPGERRSLMRRSLVGIVPKETLSRRTKQFGTRTPLLALEKNLDQLKMIFQAPLMSKLGYVDQRRLFKAVDDAVDGRVVHTVRLLRAGFT